MSAIRPDLPAFGHTPAPVPGSAARDAQAAFFRAALGQVTPPVQAVRQAPPRSVVPQVTPTTQAAEPDPDRPLRPGSLLDIRI